MVARRVRWRAGASAAPPVSRASRAPKRARIASGERTFRRDAASSTASGSPSSSRQISATAVAFSSVSWKSGRTERALPRKSRTDSISFRFSADRAVPLGGVASGGTGYSCSPTRCNGTRLVTTTRKDGVASSSIPTVGAAAAICSKLSSNKTVSRRPNRSLTTVIGSMALDSRTPSAAPMAGNSCFGSRTEASSTMWRGRRSEGVPIASTANRVLPIPPGPVSVSSLVPSNRRRTSAISRSRPTNALRHSTGEV